MVAKTTKTKQSGNLKIKNNILGNYLKNLREQRGLSAKALSEQINLSVQFIYAIENGGRSASLKSLEIYAETFKVDLNLLKDFLEKQKKLDEQDDEPQTLFSPEQEIQKLNDLLLKVNPQLISDLVRSFMEQVNDHLIKMTPNYSLTDLRNKYHKVLTFNHNTDEPIVIDGFLKLPDNNQLFFKLTRVDNLITLEVLQSDRDEIEYFEKWMGPHVFSNLCNVSVPQELETQKGVSFYWFSPSTTIQEQYDYLVKHNRTIDSVLPNSIQLAWFIHQNFEESQIEEKIG